jgi:GT2 family glycosyltransferase
MNTTPPEVVDLAEQRLTARANKDFALSDSLRDRIKDLGWLIKDIPDGYDLTPAPPFNQFQSLKELIDSAAGVVSARTVVFVIVDGWPEDTRLCLTALAENLPADAVVVALDCGNIDGAGNVLHELSVNHSNIFEFHVVKTLSEVGWAHAIAAGISLADSEFFAVMDLSTIWEGDSLTPLLTVFDNGNVALTGWRGVNVNVADQWRSFTDAEPGDVDAVLGYYMLMRTAVAREIGPNPLAKFYRNADMEWSLAIRAAGYQVVIPTESLPVRQDRHHGYHDSDPQYRDKQSKKTYDRILQAYRGQDQILHGANRHGN